MPAAAWRRSEPALQLRRHANAQANLRNDERALDECLALMQPLQEAWTRIAPTTGGSNA
jgi:hypothetical protein